MNENSTKVIPPNKISAGIIYILETAIEKVFLISPYCNFKNWTKLNQAIKSALARKIEINLFVKNSDNVFSNETIQELIDIGVGVYLVKNLHAKIYLNEEKAIITSLNLLHNSALHSIEAAIYTTNQNIIKDLNHHYVISFLENARCISYRIEFKSGNLEELADYFSPLEIEVLLKEDID